MNLLDLGSPLKYLLSRPSVRVRVFEEKEEEVGGFKLEVENVGGRSTSLRPEILLTYWVVERMHWRKMTAALDIRDVDRELPPFKARVFGATARGLHRHYPMSWFRSYLLRTTTGHWTRVHVRHALLDPLPAPRFWWEMLRFRTTGKLDGGATSMSITKMEEDRRARGPH